MKRASKSWLSPVRVDKDTWFYVGLTFHVVHWFTGRDGRRQCCSFRVPAKTLRSGLGIYGAKVRKQRERRAKKEVK